MRSGLHAETGCRKVYAGKVFQWQTDSMDAKEAFGDGCGSKYANSQSANQHRHNTISRVSAVQKSVRSLRCKHWQSGGWNIRSHQQCRLRRDGNDSYGCTPPHLEEPLWQHTCCTKAKKQAQDCHAWQGKQHEQAVATRRFSKNLHRERSGRKGTGKTCDNTDQKSPESCVYYSPCLTSILLSVCLIFRTNNRFPSRQLVCPTLKH